MTTKIKVFRLFGKLLVFLGVVVLGSFICTRVDGLIGISFVNVAPAAQIQHMVMYTLWGGFLNGTLNWLFGK